MAHPTSSIHCKLFKAPHIAKSKSAPGVENTLSAAEKWQSWRVSVGEIGVQLGWSCVAVGCGEHRGGLKMGEVWLKNGRDWRVAVASSEHRGGLKTGEVQLKNGKVDGLQ